MTHLLKESIRMRRCGSLKLNLLVLRALLLASLVATIGCDSGGPKMYPVKGKISLVGTQGSLEGGTVLFRSTTDPEILASGYIEQDGTFELYSNQGKEGTLEGDHEVLIQPPEREVGQNRVIDDRFRSYETSGIQKTVTAGENDITIEVHGPKKG